MSQINVGLYNIIRRAHIGMSMTSTILPGPLVGWLVQGPKITIFLENWLTSKNKIQFRWGSPKRLKVFIDSRQNVFFIGINELHGR